MSHNTQHDITRAQAQMIACLIHSLDNSQDVAFLAKEFEASSGMSAINSIVDQLRGLGGALQAEYDASGEDDGEHIA